MLLKALLSTLMVFASGVGVLRASVAMENYAMLAAGLGLAVAAIALGMRPGRAPIA